ncbi:putative pre-16S rRNA nuclease [bioreactor metagenome]|uniref:Putative pre-16S rRNA nuclease n=1 Tax=bioreactor metagenome TaxID=1076179 RepID=A0A645E474_9ZZZZ
MNLLAIDYGSKRIGLAISVLGIITPITPIQNDDQKFNSLKNIIDQYKIEKIFVGISEGEFAKTTQKFVDQLRNMIRCDIETVEEAVSTIEADQIFLDNNKKKKNYKKLIDSISAAVILRRVNTY